jgi:ABC-type uncharacterized transport system auxiliary subunit
MPDRQNFVKISSLECIMRDEKKIGTRRGNILPSTTIAGILLVVAFAVSSCGAAKSIHYYQLNPTDQPAAATADPYPITLVMGPFFSSSLYRDNRIVYGTSSEGMGFYDYQRWASPPTEMVQALFIRQLRTSGRFAQVYAVRSAVRGDYLLRGQLYDFKEVDGPSIVGRVTFDVELRDNKSGLTVWRMSYHQDEPVTGKTPADVVAALDRNIARGASQTTAGLDQYFAANPPKKAVAVSGN